MRLQKTHLISYAGLSLVLYLLVFSSFALHHAYAYNELVDSQGCQIGLWVQHGQGVLLANMVLAVCVIVLLQRISKRQPIFPSLALRSISARAPPFSPSL